MTPSFGSPVLDAAIRLLTPFGLVFAAYVAVHGHTSPGGGFQAGAILGAAVILIRLVRGEGAGWGPSRPTALLMACAGALAYTGLGLASLLFGGAGFDYAVLPLPAEGASRRALASLAVELCVLVTVGSVMTLIFQSLSSRSGD